MRCWRRQGRRILRGAPHPGVVPSLYVHPHPHPGRGTHRSSARARPPGWAPPERGRSEYVPAPTHLRGSSLIRKFRMARNPTTHIVATRHHQRTSAHARQRYANLPSKPTMNQPCTVRKYSADVFRLVSFRNTVPCTGCLPRISTLIPMISCPAHTPATHTPRRGVEPKLSRAAASRTSPPAGPRCPAARARSACASLRPVAARTHRGQIL
jgi:hypothetical protein